MPFRLRNAFGTFQHTMNVTPSSVKWQFALVYLDDIDVFYKSRELDIDHVQYVLTLLKNVDVTLKHMKSQFLRNLSTTSNMWYSQNKRPKIASHTTDAILGMQAATNFTKLRLFLWLCRVIRWLVPKLAKLAPLLKEKLRRDQPTTFGPLNN